MVDFTKLRPPKPQATPTDPLQIFKRLPKPPHINDLWESQSKALTQWNSRRKENDLVIKLNTGGGKTLVGLLIAQSLLNELREPALYLCANNQLVRQTIEKASEVGLAAIPYRSGLDLPAEFLNSSSILVASYQALFNGLSKFGLKISGKEPVRAGCVICDDAHTAFATLRDTFTISISRKNRPDLYQEVTTRFRADFDAVGRIGSFDDIVERGDPSILEVPYSAWRAKASAIRELLARDYSDAYKFELPLLRDHFECCHALVSGRDFAITAIHPFVDHFPTFSECRRRVYMSATIADDSSIIRTFDADPNAVAAPIVPPSLAGVGERMILIPALITLRKDNPVEVVKEIALNVAKKAGVVILVPSEKAAEKWAEIAAVVTGDGVARAVAELSAGKSRGPFVFPNRYDGIDLVGDSCRVLILDGLPRGANTYDLFRAYILQGNSSINVGLAQRIEQGTGRATRGAGDYCVVFLTGSDLISWVSRSASLDLMTPSTRTQIWIGHEISKSITSKTELLKTINQCLQRDREWTKYHAETLADRTETPAIDQDAIRGALVERQYVTFLAAKDYERAIKVLREHAEQPNVDRR